MSPIEQALQKVSRLGLDTAPIIYFIEAHPRYDALLTPIFERIDQGAIDGLTSVITLVEVLVYPLRQGRHDLVERYKQLLLTSAHFEVVPISPEIALKAADLRAHYNLRTPDALQVATAIVNRCDAFLTNDAALQRVKELKILTIDKMP
ncbi:MAG: motility twitching protein PilT [Fimbriimonadales bacterium]|nr:MAG: motility twitching protein PilT [Fimbriimonadales bacterium]